MYIISTRSPMWSLATWSSSPSGDGDDAACHVGGGGRDEEGDRLGDLVGRSDAAHRNAGLGGVAHRLGQLSVSVMPGATALTLMPSRATSLARPLVKVS